MVEGSEPLEVYQKLQEAFAWAFDSIEEIKASSELKRFRYPMIILKTPKGWKASKERGVKEDDKKLKILKEWLKTTNLKSSLRTLNDKVRKGSGLRLTPMEEDSEGPLSFPRWKSMRSKWKTSGTLPVGYHGFKLDISSDVHWRMPISSLNLLLTSNAIVDKWPNVVRVYFPPDANSLLATVRYCLDTTNLIFTAIRGLPTA